MFKRFSILTLIVFSALALAALAPLNTPAAVTAQDTVVPTIGVPTIVSTVVSTVVVPVTGPVETGIPLSTLIIIGLLILLAFAIIVGGWE